jgi:hypothetical protein
MHRGEQSLKEFFARRASGAATHFQASAVGVLLLFAFETLHLVLTTPEFLSLLGPGLAVVAAWYAIIWFVSSLVAVALFPDARRRSLTSALLLYVLVSIKVLAQETTLLWSAHWVLVFLVISLGLWTTVHLLSRRLRSDLVFWAALLVYSNFVRLLKRAWGLHPSVLSTTELLGCAVLLCAVGTAAVVGFPLLLRSRRARWFSASALTLTLCGVILAWSRPVSTSEHRRANAAPDVYVVSVDALRKDVFDRMCAQDSADSLGRLCRTSIHYENVVADGISTYQVLSRNLHTNGGCEGSLPGLLARRGYTTSMYLGRKRKRIDGAGCFANYFSGASSAFVDGYAGPSVVRRLLMRDAATVLSKVVPTPEILARFEADTLASSAPVFAYLHVLDLHAPYAGAAEHPDDPHWSAVRTFVSECYDRRCEQALIDRMRDAYTLSLAAVRRHIAFVTGVAERRNRPYKLIVTSDHGELFGEYGGVMHSNGFVPELLSIPFMVFDSSGGGPSADTCPLMLSSTALSLALGVPVSARAPVGVVNVEGTPLGHAVISGELGELQYFVAPEMLRALGTPRNVHTAPKGVLRWPTAPCERDAGPQPRRAQPE